MIHVGVGEAQALDHVEADAAQSKDDRRRSGLDLSRVDHGADAGGDAAADVADLVEGRVRVDLGDGDLGQHRIIGEGRAAHVVVDWLATDREARRAVRHDALALGRADRRAEIGLARQAGRAFAAFRRVERDDVVALLHRRHASPNVDHHAGALVAQNRREQALRIGTRKREVVGMADAGGLDLHQNLAGLRAFELNGHDLERLARLHGDCGANVHGRSVSRLKYDRHQPTAAPSSNANPYAARGMKKCGAERPEMNGAGEGNPLPTAVTIGCLNLFRKHLSRDITGVITTIVSNSR